MRHLLTALAAIGVIGLLPALAIADHDRGRSRSGLHVSVSVGAGVHYQTGRTHSRHTVTHYLPQQRVVVQQQRPHYLPAHSQRQVVIVQPCPQPVVVYQPPVVYQPAVRHRQPVVRQTTPVYRYPRPDATYYHQQQHYYYGR